MLGVCNHRTMDVKSRIILEEHCPECLRQPTVVPIEKIIDAYGIDIDYQYLTKNGEKVLGKLICIDGITPYYDIDEKKYLLLEVKANTIFIETRLADDENSNGRYRFTLAHELAHWILHRESIIKQNSEAAFVDEIHNSQMEKQADYFASALLMPPVAVKRAFFSLRGNGYSRQDVIGIMAQKFEVSKQAMKIRLDAHNLY